MEHKVNNTSMEPNTASMKQQLIKALLSAWERNRERWREERERDGEKREKETKRRERAKEWDKYSYGERKRVKEKDKKGEGKENGTQAASTSLMLTNLWAAIFRRQQIGVKELWCSYQRSLAGWGLQLHCHSNTSRQEEEEDTHSD